MNQFSQMHLTLVRAHYFDQMTKIVTVVAIQMVVEAAMETRFWWMQCLSTVLCILKPPDSMPTTVEFSGGPAISKKARPFLFPADRTTSHDLAMKSLSSSLVSVEE
jgi:hypothetical protein